MGSCTNIINLVASPPRLPSSLAVSSTSVTVPVVLFPLARRERGEVAETWGRRRGGEELGHGEQRRRHRVGKWTRRRPPFRQRVAPLLSDHYLVQPSPTPQ